MKNLILAEKPSVARDLAGVLGRFKKHEGYLEDNAYIITWAIGHLVGLAYPEDYDPELKKWHLASLPILPGSFKLKVNPKTGKQFNIVRQLLHRKDVEQIICATDAGREGELIFRYIYRLAACRKPFVRLWLSETTPAAVRKAFADLRPGQQFNALAAAAEARSQADWLIGINATRAFTVQHNTLLSVGRVQTPTLALIVHREREIKNFKPQSYWELVACFTKEDGQFYRGKWYKGETDRFNSPEAAREVQKRVAGQPGMVTGVEEKEVAEAPPLLFNLNDLQKEANKKYGMPAARTLKVAQELYETKKLITYPRTDSRHLTREMALTIPARLTALAKVDRYAGFAVTARDAGMLGRRYVNDSKVTDHTALIPTAVAPHPDKLTADQRRIYDLVARRFLAVFFPSARYRQTRVVTEAAGETFLTTGRVELEPGWKAVYAAAEPKVPAGQKPGDDREEDTALLPPLARGDKVLTTELEIQEKKTRPPKRYTDAGILAAMEGAVKFIDDRELKEAMQGHGLGTPATRAAIIERLIEVGYLKRQKKNLVPTEKGEALIDLVPDIIKDPALTGQWEKKLVDIESGAADAGEFMNGIIKLTKNIVSLARSQSSSHGAHLATSHKQAAGGKKSIGRCPLCGRDVVENSRGYGCSGYQSGCKMVIWKQIAGRQMSPKEARELLEKGRTQMLKGFTSRAGKPFEAALALGPEGRVEFDFHGGARK